MMIEALRDVAPCRLVHSYWRFELRNAFRVHGQAVLKELYVQQHCCVNLKSRTSRSGALTFTEIRTLHDIFIYFIYLFLWSSASFSKLQYLLFSLWSSSRCLLLRPLIPIPSTFPYVFPSITYFRSGFLRKMWPIQLVLFRFIVCKVFLFSLTLYNTSLFFTLSVKMIISKRLQHHFPEFLRYFWSIFRSIKVSAPYKVMLQM